MLSPKLLATRTIYEIDDETYPPFPLPLLLFPKSTNTLHTDLRPNRALDLSTRSFSPLTPPNIDLILTRLLYPTLKSYLTLRSGSFGYRGDASSLTIGLTSHLGDTLPTNGWTAEIECGPGDIACNVDWAKVVWGGWEFKIGGTAGLGGQNKVHLGWARKVTQFVKATVSVEGSSIFRSSFVCRLVS